MKSFLEYTAAAFLIVPLFIIIGGGLAIYLISYINIFILKKSTSFIGVSGIKNPFVLVILITGGVFAVKFAKKKMKERSIAKK